MYVIPLKTVLNKKILCRPIKQFCLNKFLKDLPVSEYLSLVHELNLKKFSIKAELSLRVSLTETKILNNSLNMHLPQMIDVLNPPI